jgi:hypothetical protein
MITKMFIFLQQIFDKKLENSWSNVFFLTKKNSKILEK